MLALLTAGGEGLRMKPITCRTPKPLANLCGTPLISYPINAIEQSGIIFSRKLISGGRFSRILKNDVPDHWEILGGDSENGELSATGQIHAVVYMSDGKSSGGFLSRVFR